MYHYDWNQVDDFSKKYIEEAVQNGEMKYKKGMKIIAHHDPFRKYKEADELSKNSMILKTIAYHDNEIFTTNPDIPDYTIGNYGTIINDMSLIKMHHMRTKNQYHLVKVMTVEDNHKFPKVEQMVMDTFCPKPEGKKMVIEHKDGTPHKNVYLPDGKGSIYWTEAKEKMEESLLKHENIIKHQSRF